MYSICLAKPLGELVCYYIYTGVQPKRKGKANIWKQVWIARYPPKTGVRNDES